MGRSRAVIAAAVLMLGVFASDGAWTMKRAGGLEVERPHLVMNVKTPVHKTKRVAVKKRSRKVDDDLDKLDARLALLWARVQEMETKILAQREREEGKASA